MPELGDYYLGLLRERHPDSKLFIGMNHGSAPAWEGRLRRSGLDVEVRWSRPEIGDYWDATGFLTALEGFHRSEEAFHLVWFGHTKGGGRSRYDRYADIRGMLEERFWARRAEIDTMFADPAVGLFAPHFCPLPAWHMGSELLALLRIYRSRFAPLGLHCRGTFYVMRGALVRAFCAEVDAAFFCTDPGAYGAGRWFFEIGFPNIASMQGFEPFIDQHVPGNNDPRNDVWLAYDVKQNHRIANGERERWRADPVGFRPKAMVEQLIDGSRLGEPRPLGSGMQT